MNEEKIPNADPSAGSGQLLPPQENAEEGNIKESLPAKAPRVKLTERELAQRRDAAKKSTGPRTAKGKDRSKLNAMRHGLYAKDIVNPVLDDRADVARFGALRRTLLRDLKPEGILERLLVEEIAGCFWRLKRALRSESRQAWVAEERERTGPSPREQAAQLAPYMLAGGSLAKIDMELLEERFHERGERNAILWEAKLDRTLMAPGQEAILRFEASVKRHLYRALDTLTRLQKARRQAAAPPPPGRAGKSARTPERKEPARSEKPQGQAAAGAAKPGAEAKRRVGSFAKLGTGSSQKSAQDDRDRSDLSLRSLSFYGTNRPEGSTDHPVLAQQLKEAFDRMG